MKKILFITAFHPNANGIIGAGEAISGKIIDEFIAEDYNVDVFVIAPVTQRFNKNLVDKCNLYIQKIYNKKSAFLSILSNIKYFSLFAPWFFTRVNNVHVELINELLRENNYDFVWLDFPSTLGFVNKIQHDDIRYSCHDIVSQRIARTVIKRFFTSIVKKIESKLFNKLTNISVLSDKDLTLVRRMNFKKNCSVIDLSGQTVGCVDNAVNIEEIVSQFQKKINFVFFGNMRRSENHWSIILFIMFIFSRLTRKNKNFHLWVLGVQPRFLLRLFDKINVHVHVVGAVDNPFLAFKKSDFCIVPLLYGAGVKIKVIQMLEAGGYVISTPIGSEGVPENDKLVTVKFSELYRFILNNWDK